MFSRLFLTRIEKIRGLVIIRLIKNHFRTILPLFKVFLKAVSITAVQAALIVLAVVSGVYFPSIFESGALSESTEAAAVGTRAAELTGSADPVFGEAGFGFASGGGIGPSGAPDNFLGFVVLDSALALDPVSPLSNILPDRNSLLIYKIKKGDTISKIAANFGISPETIIGANPNLKSLAVKAGQEIVILPVSGVLHLVRGSDTVDAVAALYNVKPQDIINFNFDAVKILQTPGSTLIIPGAKPLSGRSFGLKDDLPNLSNFFAVPTTGWNWGRLHDNNAVDIANSCGTPIYAAAEGLVIEEASTGWNYGFGRYLKIEHPNKTQTLYSHTSVNKVKTGDYVLRGDLIAYIGNTGNTHGPTGCHLHFEVRGAKNPFAKY